jgi:hypothetical protein
VLSFLRLWKKQTDHAYSIESRVSQEMLDERLLTDHAKTEYYLMVALAVRPCALITIPAELPDGAELGRKIDTLCSEDLRKVTEASAEQKPPLILKLRSRIQESFRKVVFSSVSYRAHLNWARKLGLQTLDIEVRPSIHELYLFKNPTVEKQLKQLSALRASARKQALLKGFVGTRANLAYAEEMSADYLNSAGKLLGYPPCCVKAYTDDRLSGRVNAEMRACTQLRQMGERERQSSVYAYFVRNFFPCHPGCQNAIEIGRGAYQRLTDVNYRLGAIYLDCIRKNAETIMEYPELTKQCRQKMEKAGTNG